MANRFYTFLNQLISGSVAKASEVNAELQAAEVGFLAVQGELNTAIKFPASEDDVDQRLTEAPATRAGRLLGFTTAGAITTLAALVADFSLGGFRLRNVPTATENDEPVNLAQMSAYSAGLTGLPAIAGQAGHLTTDGASVSWSGLGRQVPATTALGGGEQLSFSSSQTRWVVAGNNACFDPNGTIGSSYWTTSLSRFSDINGPHWTCPAGLTTATFDHKPAASLAEVPVGALKNVALSVYVDTSGVSAGTISLVARYYNSGLGLISESAATSIPAATAGKNYSLSVTTPASTAYVAAVLKFVGVTSSAYGTMVRNMKVEAGSYPTPFNDFKTLALAYGNVSTTILGTGFTNPVIRLGDATSTGSAFDMRSAAGGQSYDVRFSSVGGTSGVNAKGQLVVSSYQNYFSGPVGASSETDLGVAGAGITVSFGAYQYAKVSLNAASTTITLAGGVGPVGRYLLKVVQDATGGRTITWAGLLAANCVGNAFPTLSTVANGVTFVSLYWDGTAFWASSNPWD